MLNLMLEKEGLAKKKKARRNKSSQNKVKAQENWFLYILKCNDGTLYTGITKDLGRRFKMHNEGKASRYTRTRRPVELVYHEVYPSRTHALVRECEIKEFSKEKKNRLLQSFP